MTTVFVDVDTQNDFMLPSGALYVPGAEHIIGTVAKLNRYAAANNITVLSTADAHAENDGEFGTWPPHCIAGTIGQQKPAETLLDRRVVVPNTAAPLEWKPAQQVILEKQFNDCFTAQHLPAILAALKADRYFVYGVVTEICVQHAVLGLLKTGAKVEVVTDAIRSLGDEASAAALALFQTGGATLTTASAVTQ